MGTSPAAVGVATGLTTWGWDPDVTDRSCPPSSLLNRRYRSINLIDQDVKIDFF
jgi:hypothetical protein